MHTNAFAKIPLTAILCLMMVSVSQAITINVQYEPGTTLFYPAIDGTAKAAINAAAADISAAITTSLDPITTDVFMGTNGSTSATFDWDYGYNRPSDGNYITIESPSVAADTVTVFAGTRSLLGSTLGFGGPAGLGLSLGASGFPHESPAAVASAEAQSQAALSRGGGGPIIGELGGAFNFSGTITNYSVDYGVAYGSLTLDYDEDNNGVIDSPANLDDYWHWNHTTEVGTGKSDLYSVALHEILHAIGIGASDSWDDLVSGSTWNGSEVQAITGSGANLVSGGGNHIASGVMSTRISDGTSQEVAMDPSITDGKRKELTVLDLAFLRDIGYETITPSLSSPPDFDGDGDVDSGDLLTIRNAYGLNSSGDVDDDTDTDGADFLAWQRQYTGSLVATSLTASVPEPCSAVLLVTAGMMMGCRRKKNRRGL